MKQQILIIDDDPIINFIHSKIINKKFTEVPLISFENAQIALQSIKENPAIKYTIFLDLNMPKLDGWGFLDAISLKDQELNYQVHIVTSSVDPADRLRANEYERVISYLTKPLKLEDLDKISLDQSTI